MEEDQDLNSVCIRCGKEVPLNAEGLCAECEEIEKGSADRCKICGNVAPLNQDGLCEGCAQTQQENIEPDESE